MLSHTDEAVLMTLLANPREEHNIRGLSKATHINYRLVYESVKKLAKNEIITLRTIGKSTVCNINKKKNHAVYAYIENLRLQHAESKYIQIKVVKNELEKMQKIFYTILIFGSYASGKATAKSDIDIMFILPNEEDASNFEQSAKRLFYKFNYDIHISITSEHDFIEMLKKSDDFNGANEALKNHIILYGGEQFFRMVSKA